MGIFMEYNFTNCHKCIWQFSSHVMNMFFFFRAIYFSTANSQPTLASTETCVTWWRHQTFSALLAICAGNSPVPGEFPTQRPVTRRFNIFFDLRLNKRLSKQSWGWRFETLSRPLWRHHNESIGYCSAPVPTTQQSRDTPVASFSNMD